MLHVIGFPTTKCRSCWHGWWNLGGAKISKARQHVDPFVLAGNTAKQFAII
jgi:hypothetical protein